MHAVKVDLGRSLRVSLEPADLEAETEVLQLVAGSNVSHVAVAQSMWNDMYGNVEDPELLGFGRRAAGKPGVPAEIWQAFKAEWRELACTDSEKYKSLRAQVKSLRGNPATVVVSSIAAGLASALGIAAGILVPFVAILLHGVLTLGNNVICRTWSRISYVHCCWPTRARLADPRALNSCTPGSARLTLMPISTRPSSPEGARWS